MLSEYKAFKMPAGDDRSVGAGQRIDLYYGIYGFGRKLPLTYYMIYDVISVLIYDISDR